MSGTAATLFVLGVITGLITIGTFMAKTINTIANLKVTLERLEWKIDSVELHVNGVSERSEHLATRIQQYVQKNADTIEDIQAYLQKETSYERRSNR